MISAIRCARRFSWLAACCLLGWSGCGQEPAKLTQIVVVVDSDLQAPEELDALELSIDGARTRMQQTPNVEAALEGPDALPRSLGLVHAGGPLGPVRIAARGLHEGATVVERVAVVHFEAGRTLKLELPLSRACDVSKVSCEDDQTCDQGVCAPSEVPELPEFDGHADRFVDGGVGGMNDAAAPDAGELAAPDAGESSDAGGAVDPPDGGHETRPLCSIVEPFDGDSVYEGDEIAFDGSCGAVDDAGIGYMRWRSSVDGTLSVKTPFRTSALSVGEHDISLCMVDLGDPSATECAPSVRLTVKSLPAIEASIVSIEPTTDTEGVYDAQSALVAQGQGSGLAPLSYQWADSLQGDLGTQATASYGSALAGQHTLRLVVKDARGRQASAERSFVAQPSQGGSLFAPYKTLNVALGFSNAEVTALASDGAFHYVGTQLGLLFRISASAPPQTASTTSVSTSQSGQGGEPSQVNGLDVDTVSARLYVATSLGLDVCTNTAGDIGNCQPASSAADLTNVTRSVRRVSNGVTDYLLVGALKGLYVADLSDLDNGELQRNNVLFYAMAEAGGAVWFASSEGLSKHDLSLGNALSGNPELREGGPLGLSSLAAGSAHVWVGSTAGLARMEMSTGTWETWSSSYDQALFGRLVSNEVVTLAVTHPVIGNVAHEVVWIGTSSGLSRFDPAIPSFTTYTESEGLLGSRVLRVVALTGGDLLLGTDAGLMLFYGR